MMQDIDLVGRIKDAGRSGVAPALDDQALAAAGQRRRRRRAARTVIALTCLLVMTAVGVTLSGTFQTPRPVVAGGPTAVTRAPGFAAPACIPTGPAFVSDTGAPVQDWSVRAGAALQVAGVIPKNLPDRPITAVQLLLGVAGSDLGPTETSVTEPKNQVASAAVTISAETFAIELQIPATTSPGAYPLFAVSSFPAPSLCGHSNPPGAPDTGRMIVPVGTIRVP